MRRQAEGRAVHHRDPFGLEQVADEILVGLDRLALGRPLAEQPGAGRIDVERAFRPRAIQPGDLVQPIDDEVAPLLEQLRAFGG